MAFWQIVPLVLLSVFAAFAAGKRAPPAPMAAERIDPDPVDETPRRFEQPPMAADQMPEIPIVKKPRQYITREYVGYAAPDLSGLGWLKTNQNWGKEAKQGEFCPEDTFAVGFQLKFDAYRFFHDNTALNGIRLFCGNSTTAITSLEGKKGEWMNTNFCQNGEMLDGGTMTGDTRTGFFRDDVSVLNLEMYCGPDPRGQFGGAYDAGMMQRYEGVRYLMHCPEFSRICGLKTTVNTNAGFFVDEVGLTNVLFYCCKVDQP